MKKIEDESSINTTINITLDNSCYERIITKSLNMLCLTSEGKILQVTESICSVLEYTIEELLTSNIEILFPKKEEFKKFIEKINESFENYFLTLISKSQSIKNFVISCNRLDGGTVYLVLKDITDEIQLKTSLEDLKKKYYLISEAARDIIFIHDLEENILYINETGVRKSGYTKEELLKKKVSDLIPKEYMPTSRDLRKDRLVGDDYISIYEMEYLQKSGDRIPVEVCSSPVIENGKIIGILHVVRDISIRKNAEKTSQKTEEKYRRIVENANSIIIEFDAKGKILSMNAYGLNFFGYSKEELVGADIAVLIPSKSEIGIMDSIDFVEYLINTTEEHAVNINENIKKNGERCWIYWTNKLIIDEGGGVIEIVSIGTDITKNKNIQSLLKDSERKFRALFDNSNHLIIFLDMSGKILEINNFACQILGYQKEEIIGKNINELSSSRYSEMIHRRIEETIKYGHSTYETEYLTKSNVPIPFQIEGRILEMGDKRLFIKIGTDISMKKEADERIKRQFSNFCLEDGSLYFVEKQNRAIALGAFKDLIKLDYIGTVVSRKEEEDVKKLIEEDHKFYRISNTFNNKDWLHVSIEDITNIIKKTERKGVYLIDCFDYIISRKDFRGALHLAQTFRDIALFEGVIVIMIINPDLVNEKELELLKEEGKEIESKAPSNISKTMVEILRYIYDKNKHGIEPSYSDISNKFRMTRPTVKKNIDTLCSCNLVSISSWGRAKKLKVSAKGENILVF